MTDDTAAECELRQLHARLVDAVWRQDRAAFADCFAADAEWQIAGLHLRGRGAIGAQLAVFLQRSQRVLMLFGTPLLEVRGREAVGRLPITEFAKLRDGGSFRTIGVYHDRYVRDQGRWWIARRVLALHYRGAPDFTAPFADLADPGQFPSGQFPAG